jgi:uncharacterized membrane protein YhaH (DUF805 family)
MTFFESVRSVLTKYATFSGRACRSEYWWFVLFNVLVGLVAIPLDLIFGTDDSGQSGLIDFLSRIALLVPNIAVTTRRLHDAGWSGWWLFTIVPPFIFVFMKGDGGPNDYGPNPLGEVRAGSTGPESDSGASPG